jgi:hypothetical protein
MKKANDGCTNARLRTAGETLMKWVINTKSEQVSSG